MTKTSAQEATERLREHFSTLTNGQFVENVRRFSSKDVEQGESSLPSPIAGAEYTEQLTLFQPQPTRIPLKAYLACALTGLSADEKEEIIKVSDEIEKICQQHDIDLYQPRNHTDPESHPEIDAGEVFRRDKNRVLESDLLIALVHHPSWGAGEELDFAYNALLPMILISPDNTRVSRMVTGIPTLKVHLTYSNVEDLISELNHCLSSIRPILKERKLAFRQNNENIVGKNIRISREEQGLTRQEVACRVPGLTVDALTQLEESPDRISNPSLIQLRQIATVLKTTVGELIEPDFNERAFSYIEEIIEGRVKNRYPDMSPWDRKKITARFLLRIADRLLDEGDN